MLLVSYGFNETQILDMSMDKFKLYVSAATYKTLSSRAFYIYDIVAVISGIFGKKNNKTISNQLKTLDM